MTKSGHNVAQNVLSQLYRVAILGGVTYLGIQKYKEHVTHTPPQTPHQDVVSPDVQQNLTTPMTTSTKTFLYGVMILSVVLSLVTLGVSTQKKEVFTPQKKMSPLFVSLLGLTSVLLCFSIIGLLVCQYGVQTADSEKVTRHIGSGVLVALFVTFCTMCVLIDHQPPKKDAEMFEIVAFVVLFLFFVLLGTTFFMSQVQHFLQRLMPNTPSFSVMIISSLLLIVMTIVTSIFYGHSLSRLKDTTEASRKKSWKMFRYSFLLLIVVFIVSVIVFGWTRTREFKNSITPLLIKQIINEYRQQNESSNNLYELKERLCRLPLEQNIRQMIQCQTQSLNGIENYLKSSSVTEQIPNDGHPTPLNQKLTDLLHDEDTVHRYLMYVKIGFAIFLVGISVINSYTTFIVTKPGDVVAEIVLMFVTGFLTLFGIQLMRKQCVYPRGVFGHYEDGTEKQGYRQNIKSCLLFGLGSVAFYLIFELTGLNRFMFTYVDESQQKSKPTTPAGSSENTVSTDSLQAFNQRIEFQVIGGAVVICLICVLIGLYLLLGYSIGFDRSNSFLLSQPEPVTQGRTDIRKLWLRMNALKHASSHSSSHELSPESPHPLIFESCSYTSFPKFLAEALWFGFFFNVAYLYVYYNRNKGNKKALTAKVWIGKIEELCILFIKFGIFHMILQSLGTYSTLVVNPLVVVNETTITDTTR